MKKISILKILVLVPVLFLVLIDTSCKKDNPTNNNNTVSKVATPTYLGVYEADSSIYKELIMAITKIGNETVDYGLVFDTGSGGMVIDASGIIPASMITSSGFSFTGDSTIVNGITITNQTSTITYGDDCSTSNDTVYGNLAYAQVTVGDANGNIIIKRLPFFLYYKATMSDGTLYPSHEFDVFGVNEEYDVTFANNAYITSPFSYYNVGTGLTSGFKIAALGTSNFSYDGNYAGVLTLGLTAADLAASSGFVMNQLTYNASYGYVPIIPAKVTYNSTTFSSYVLFDTGTEPYSYLEDPTYTGSIMQLPVNSPVSIATTSGFTFSYSTSATENLTNVENSPCADVSIISLEYFLNNEYLYDFADHKLGLKNN